MGWRDEVRGTESKDYEPKKEGFFKRSKRFVKNHSLELGAMGLSVIALAIGHASGRPDLEKVDPTEIKLLDEDYRDPKEVGLQRAKEQINDLFDQQ